MGTQKEGNEPEEATGGAFGWGMAIGSLAYPVRSRRAPGGSPGADEERTS